MKANITLRFLLPLTIAACITDATAQVGINATGAAPAPSAMMDLTSTTKGLLIPRMTEAQRLVDEHQPDAMVLAKFPFPLRISAGSYVEKYGPGGRYDFLEFLSKVPCPVLLTLGSVELETMSAFRGLREAIADAIPPNSPVQITTIEGADHFYAGQHAALGLALMQWITRS